MRGEYVQEALIILNRGELPPHARRIPQVETLTAAKVGTTSACAENTRPITAQQTTAGNYLRMRGEYELFDRYQVERMELPPHARRIHPLASGACLNNGTTSACAENTLNELGLL